MITYLLNFRQDSFHKKHKRKHKPHSKKKSSHSHFTEDELKSRRAKGSEVNDVFLRTLENLKSYFKPRGL